MKIKSTQCHMCKGVKWLTFRFNGVKEPIRAPCFACNLDAKSPDPMAK